MIEGGEGVSNVDDGSISVGISGGIDGGGIDGGVIDVGGIDVGGGGGGLWGIGRAGGGCTVGGSGGSDGGCSGSGIVGGVGGGVIRHVSGSEALQCFPVGSQVQSRKLKGRSDSLYGS